MRFEIKKLLTNKIIIALFALIITAIFVYFAITIGTFSKGYNPVLQTDLGEKYNEQCEAQIRTAERIKSETNDVYTRRLSDKIIAVCENRHEIPNGDNSAISWFRVVLDDSYISLLPLFFCVLMSAELFCSDRGGVYKLNFTSKNGRLVLYKNKALALVIFSACTAVVFTLSELAAVLLKYKIENINSPIQTEIMYFNCAYNIGFLEFIFAIIGIRILLCIFVCFLTAFFANLFGNLIASATLSAGVCALLLVLYERTLANHGSPEIAPTKYFAHHALLKFSPICLLCPNGFFVSRNYVNVLGFPITELFFNIAATVIMTIILAIFSGFLFAQKRRAIV